MPSSLVKTHNVKQRLVILALLKLRKVIRAVTQQ